ncbi:AsnC family transcriptional regulator [Billgrantia endophytica]|uniref:siroheme decarboxylase n=1 Tax=Billgrantia endophytica TaxID=2033802 RepID=A0A2N7UAJ7_9GAMM|nr:AsnC family transcriptional regulator [Halomonas endophytica]PMR77421.1 protein nirH [Halomonas endophytica]
MSVSTCPSDQATREARDENALDALDRAIVLATQSGLPLVPDPWAAIAGPLGIDGSEVRRRMQRMLDSGVIRRIAAVPNHYRLGYLANGMTVWDVDDAHIDRLGRVVAALPGVSHCYRRPRHLPEWSYNLFAMLHGHTRDDVEQQAEALCSLLGDACRDHRILYSSRILKKTGLRLAARSDRQA